MISVLYALRSALAECTNKVLAGELGQIYFAETDQAVSMATNQIFAVDAARMNHEAPPVSPDHAPVHHRFTLLV